MSLLVVPGLLLVAVFTYYLLVTIFRVQRWKWLLKDVPGLEEKWIIGHGHHFMNKRPVELFQTLMDGTKKLGKIWKVFLLHEAVLVVSDPKVFEAVLCDHKFITKAKEYDVTHNWLGDGLLVSSGKKWFKRRKVLTPAFHFNILEQFVEVFDRNSNILVESLAKQKAGAPVDVYPFVTLAALDIICETSMGASVDAQRNADSEYVRAVKDITHVLHLRMFDVVLRNNFAYRFTKKAQEEKRHLAILHGFTDSVIKSRREELLKEKAQMEDGTMEVDDLGRKKRMALLDVLLQSTIDGKPLTNADIREEVDTFMFEGHDTTTSGISFALYCIAQHPEVQQKLLKEIHEVIGEDKKTPVTHKMLNDLHYLDLVLKESMRLFPPVPLIGRIITEDTVINGVTFPAGVPISFGIYFIQRDPELFPEPDKFIPERFDKSRFSEKANPYVYIPFSAGPRNCIGQKFAVLEMKATVSKILRNFKLSVDASYKGPEHTAQFILKPQNGVVLNLVPR